MLTNKLLKDIYDFAKHAHINQFRKDGITPFINHPLNVAEILYFISDKNNIELLAAALLHDIIEDTEYTTETLQIKLNEFGNSNFVNKVMFYVTSMTNKYIKKSYPNLNRKQRKKLEFTIFKLWTDDNLKRLKLADIISNLRNFSDLEFNFAHTYIFEEFELIRILKIDDIIWWTAVEEITTQFKNLIIR